MRQKDAYPDAMVTEQMMLIVRSNCSSLTEGHKAAWKLESHAISTTLKTLAALHVFSVYCDVIKCNDALKRFIFTSLFSGIKPI